MKNGFEELEVWKKAHGLTLEIYKEASNFPSSEKHRLIDQLCRAASSVPTNIAEGRGRFYKKEYIKFLYIARGSLEETKYLLILAKDLKYINESKYNVLMSQAIDIGKMINGLIKSLDPKDLNTDPGK